MRSITINGRQQKVAALTIAQLVLEQGLRPDRLVVEHNRAIIRQEQWADTSLCEGDTVELLRFVGGG